VSIPLRLFQDTTGSLCRCLSRKTRKINRLIEIQVGCFSLYRSFSSGCYRRFNEVERSKILGLEVCKGQVAGLDLDSVALGVQPEIREDGRVGVEPCHVGVERFGAVDNWQRIYGAKSHDYTAALCC
jgi:hypothetical protein